MISVKIDKKLNLVIPVAEEDDEKKIKAYVHSTPVSSEVWEKYWNPMGVAFTRIMTAGHGRVSGPRIADKMLRQVATEMDMWEGPTGVNAGLISEIHRLTNVLSIGKNGWEMIPFYEARKTILDSEEAAEIEAAIIFFTLVWYGHRRNIRKQMLVISMNLWGAQIESSSCTEYMTSLQKSTARESSGATAAA